MKAGMAARANRREKAKGNSARRMFHRLRDGVMLRRTKDLIAHKLKGKVDNIVFCPMTKLQQRVYQRILASPVRHRP